MIAALLLASAAAPSAGLSDTAVQLGREIARSGTLATLAPLKAKSEIDALIADNPGFTDEEKLLLRRLGEERATALLARVIDVEGRALAANLSIDDMRAIIAFERMPAAQRKRAAMVPVIIDTAEQLDGIDYLGEVRSAFCAQSGKLCEQPD